MTLFFTSDQHAGHENIIRFDNNSRPLLDKLQGRIPRPFTNAEEMDEALIENWNSVVAPNDKVICLGDLSFHKDTQKADVWASRLNGQKYLLMGNHRSIDKTLVNNGSVSLISFVFGRDYQFEKKFGKERPFTLLPAEYELLVPDSDAPNGHQMIVLSHYSHEVWNKSHHGSWHLYGHSHGSLPDNPRAKKIDVGCMLHDLKPISYEQVKSIMATKSFVPVDHHE